MGQTLTSFFYPDPAPGEVRKEHPEPRPEDEQKEPEPKRRRLGEKDEEEGEDEKIPAKEDGVEKSSGEEEVTESKEEKQEEEKPKEAAEEETTKPPVTRTKASAAKKTRKSSPSKAESYVYKPSQAEMEKCKSEYAKKRLEGFYASVNELYQYKKEHGDCLVPAKYGPLGQFVQNTRKEKKKLEGGEKSTLTPERLKVLNEVGFAWSAARGQKR